MADPLDPATVPAVVRARAESIGAHRWLSELPALVAALEAEWQIAVGAPYADATEAFVAEAILPDGSPAVVKLLVPHSSAPPPDPHGRTSGSGDRGVGDNVSNEMAVLRLAGGEGCVRLLRGDEGRGALLLERLGPSLHDLGVPLARRHAILCDLAARVWRPAPGCGLPTGAEKGRWLADFITTAWEELDRPCSEAAVAHALAVVARRIAAHDDERAVLVHGDVHEWNALRSGAGFALVDPDGLLAEAEYDLGVIMREDPVELLRGDPWARARWLADRTGLDATAVWEWGVVERVATGLSCTRVGLQPFGRQMLATADAVAD